MLRKIEPRVRLAFAREANRVVVLLDREKQARPAGCLAEQLEMALQKSISSSIQVVIKDRCFENWLIACPGSYTRQKARFPNHEIVGRSIPDGAADRHDRPSSVINSACGRKSAYDKMVDSTRILRHADVDDIARHSRSFRRFLAVLGDPLYKDSSLSYVSPPAAGKRSGAQKPVKS
jgi:hypothetical protein